MSIPSEAKRTATLFVWLPVVLAAVGCASQASRYYTLVGSDGNGEASGNAAVVVVMTEVKIPDMVDRMQLVVHDSDADVQIMEHERWAVSLRDQLTAVLVRDLRAQLRTPNVVSDTRFAGRSDAIQLIVDVERFDARAGKEALIEARWKVRAGASGAVHVESRVSVQPLSDRSPEALVRAWSAGLQEVSAAIAESIRREVTPA